jgi:hypothetical protein
MNGMIYWKTGLGGGILVLLCLLTLPLGVYSELRKKVNVGIITIELDQPTGDPTKSPAPATCEFTYMVNILTIDCQAKVEPANQEVIDYLNKYAKWSISDIPGSALSWDTPWPGDPKSGKGVKATAKFTGLPSLNSSFGTKTVTLSIEGSGISKTTNIEVFYYAEPITNPGGLYPNWFYYWNQVCGDPNAVYNDAGTPNHYGCFPAMYLYPFEGDKNVIWIGSQANTTSTPTTGIDCFANVILHEQQHRKDFIAANAIVPGWSWKQDPHNHYDAEGNDLDVDDDDIPDAWELGRGHGINSTLPVTHSSYDGLLDSEWRARYAETVNEDAYFGKQHKTESYQD